VEELQKRWADERPLQKRELEAPRKTKKLRETHTMFRFILGID
jgi:hypothetical protein